MKGLTRQVKKSARKKLADENNEKWRSLTTEQQIQALDQRLGKGVGAVKQRARLAKKLVQEQAAPKPKKK